MKYVEAPALTVQCPTCEADVGEACMPARRSEGFYAGELTAWGVHQERVDDAYDKQRALEALLKGE